MCTLIVDWDPSREDYLLVVANRDERTNRSFEEFDVRHFDDPGISGLIHSEWDANNCKSKRVDYINVNYNRNINTLKEILSYQSNSEDAVCIVDPEESHQTISSCIIEGTINRENEKSEFKLHHIYSRPSINKIWAYTEYKP